jgi:hypothetical protein
MLTTVPRLSKAQCYGQLPFNLYGCGAYVTTSYPIQWLFNEISHTTSLISLEVWRLICTK